MPPNLMTARNLTKVYDTGEVKVYALRGVDLDNAQGELIVLLGPSGSGKSTMLNILGGLDSPTSGEVLFQGKPLTGASSAALTRYRRQHVGFIFPFYNLVLSLTARENVALVTEIAEDPIPAEEALALVAMSDRIDHFPAVNSSAWRWRGRLPSDAISCCAMSRLARSIVRQACGCWKRSNTSIARSGR
jgi:putative ABC transport system ATP-binding protein